jgi:Cu/Ag efflux protein CusF
MKKTLRSMMTVLTVAIGLGSGGQAFCDRTPASASDEKTLNGVAISVDAADKAVLVKGLWGAKRFNVAEDCKVVNQDNTAASLAELRPGQRLEITYENAQGVLVAHQIRQNDWMLKGEVVAMDPAGHTLVVRHKALDKTFVIGPDCKVVLREGKAGTLADVRPGHRVTVTYEHPNGNSVAREIEQPSATFSGALTAIDLSERTLKAKEFLSAKTFQVGDDCKIVIAGQPNGKLSDLKLGDKLVFSYDDVSGVNVVNRIAPAEPGSEPPATTAATHNSGLVVPAVR